MFECINVGYLWIFFCLKFFFLFENFGVWSVCVCKSKTQFQHAHFKTVSTHAFQYSFSTHISTQFQHTFQVQFQHAHSRYGFNTHISTTVSTHTFQHGFRKNKMCVCVCRQTDLDIWENWKKNKNIEKKNVWLYLFDNSCQIWPQRYNPKLEQMNECQAQVGELYQKPCLLSCDRHKKLLRSKARKLKKQPRKKKMQWNPDIRNE